MRLKGLPLSSQASILTRLIPSCNERQALAPGQVCYITTGAPVPPGADAVVMVEDTEKVGASRVKIVKTSKIRCCEKPERATAEFYLAHPLSFVSTDCRVLAHPLSIVSTDSSWCVTVGV